nr:hypothetical protein [uncultured Rhodopila sp.]
MSGSFFNTNVLVYTASGDAAKADRAEESLRGCGSISVQVVNELTHAARRTMRMSWPENHAFLSMVRGDGTAGGTPHRQSVPLT